ncbi:MAG TPA: DNA alkylation repair protein [Bacteroidales bacterium]
MTPKEYLLPLKTTFEENANPSKAMQMKAYMRGQFEFYGIASPERKIIFTEHRKNYGLIPDAHTSEIVKECWQMPQRDYQYFAMEMLNKVSKKCKPETIQLYETMITEKSWWDTVDFIAANLVGSYFKIYPELIESKTTEWMDSENIWLQRTCLLFQLKYKNKLDTELLEGFILRLKDAKPFFIRKAIGWVLREYSKTNPEYVKYFVHNTSLSGLSRIEALKWMTKKQIA